MTPASMFIAFRAASAAWCLAAFLLGPWPEKKHKDQSVACVIQYQNSNNNKPNWKPQYPIQM